MANVTWLSGVVKSHHIKEVVNVTFWQWGGETLILHWGWWTSGVVIVLGGERLRWWMSEVVNVWGGECLGWWTSDFTLGVVNVWGGECLGWWTSEVVNVWGGERLILHRGWWTSEVVNVWGGERLILHWGWWTSGVVNVWFYTGGGERLGWWMSGWWTSYNLTSMLFWIYSKSYVMSWLPINLWLSKSNVSMTDWISNWIVICEGCSPLCCVRAALHIAGSIPIIKPSTAEAFKF